MLIYGIVNQSGKVVYVGQTINPLSYRKYGHKRTSKTNDSILARAFRKYGFETFKFIILKNDIDTCEKLCYYESYFIEKYKTFPCGTESYNMTSGGEKYKLISEEYSLKLSKIQLKRYENESERQKTSDAMKQAYKDNSNSNMRQSISTIKRYENESERQKTSDAMKQAYKDNPDFRKKQSIATKQRYIDNPELRELQSIISKTDTRMIEGRKKAHESRRIKIICIELEKEFSSYKECADFFKVKYQSIIKAVKNGTKSKGYKFKIKEGDNHDSNRQSDKSA